ncbi:carotenoid isomerooxygenase [Anthonomus grandis grandis]|uniref:carotenoid isomerooxygenase n=1 Tax=Anthonomus grandis grandis TaxID=2921223 RepID=UPI002165888B|nr:carotenoid isomerooxygenase [Anthonomus grandis grandis]
MNDKIKERLDSGRATPVFTWSPLPPRKKLGFTEKNSSVKNDLPISEPYYPNCEFQIWLRSCEQEIEEPLEGVVTGLIPEWLNGSLIRNGPGSLKAGKDEFQHLFDSSALLHRFGIKNGTVTYQCKFLRSEIYKKIWTANRLVMTEFGTKAVPDPCHTIFQKVATMFSFKSDMSDNAMISVYPFRDEIYAFNEMPFIHRIDPANLDTLERVDLSQHVSIVNHTSHPHVMEDSSVYNIGMTIYPTGPYYSVIHFATRSTAKEMFASGKIVASIPARWPLNPSYMHTFGITENYFVIVEQPFSVSLPGILALKFQNEPLAGAFRWYEDQYTQINVISRKTGRLTHKFQAETFFYLHIINQYEDTGYLILDVCAYRDPSMLDCMYFETMRNMQNNPDYAKMFRGRPIRFVLPLNALSPEEVGEANLVNLKGTKASAKYLVNGEILAKAERLCNMGCETPRINYNKFLGKKYRYFYAISSDVDSDNPGTIIKVDTVTKTTKTWQQKNCFPGEPVFVPSTESDAEDHGVILSVMVWGQEDTNHVGLLVLDAKSFEEIGRAEFRTPSAVPKCLHGWFLPEK